MKIGEVARRVGLATSAIRFYEEEGLIPQPLRTESGYRDYDPSVVDRIRFIRAGQAVGLTLRHLNQVLQIRDQGGSPCRHVAEMLDVRIQDVDQRLEELRVLRQNLNAMRLKASDLDPADCSPESVCRIVTQTT